MDYETFDFRPYLADLPEPDDVVFGVAYRLAPEGTPGAAEHDRYASESARHKLAAMLARKLADGRHWTIRLIQETVPPAKGEMPWSGQEVRIRAEVTAVQYERVRMYRSPDYSAMPTAVLAASAVDEVKGRISRAMARLGDRLAFWRKRGG